jgi:acetylornithine deacetylase/succinyl-diaminopimelate desuccinylase-like protein
MRAAATLTQSGLKINDRDAWRRIDGGARRGLPSGAGHDAMAFRGRLPIAMLFVRCRDGISHHPGEYASPEDIDAAARILADFVDTFQPLA